MPIPSPQELKDRFAAGIHLDHLWCQTTRMPLDDKESVLVTLLDVLHERGSRYALIGEIAVQLYAQEPRTTDDIDLAVESQGEIPRESLLERGFTFDGLHDYTENWLGPAPAGTPRKKRVRVQFSHDVPMAEAVDRSVSVDVGFPLQLVTLPDLVELKLLAAESEERQRSKGVQDVSDVMRLVEQHPEVDSPESRGATESGAPPTSCAMIVPVPKKKTLISLPVDLVVRGKKHAKKHSTTFSTYITYLLRADLGEGRTRCFTTLADPELMDCPCYCK